jgi:hypothetical protein
MLLVFDDGFDVRLCFKGHGAREIFFSSPPPCVGKHFFEIFFNFFSRHAKGVFPLCGCWCGSAIREEKDAAPSGSQASGDEVAVVAAPLGWGVGWV